MTSPLFPCPSCHRHVRLGSGACPFCASALPESPELVPNAPTGSLKRAALFVFATTVAACSSSQPTQTATPEPVTVATSESDASTTPSSGGTVIQTPSDPTGQGNFAPMYGMPATPVETQAIDASAVADATADASTDTAVADASTPDAGRRDAGRAHPTRPPVVDPGAIMVRYGSPPADFA